MDKRCSKCDVLKPSTEYYTYFHKPQGKWRTRNVCNGCFKEQKRLYKESIKKTIIVQPEVPELEPEVSIPEPVEVINPLSTNPDYRQCRVCLEYKLLDDYYHSKQTNSNRYHRHHKCKECTRTHENEKSKREREQLLEEQGGSERILTYPNEYVDEWQQKFTFKLLHSFGWIFNEEKQIWYKPGIKDENGVWDKIKNNPLKPRRTEDYRHTRFKRYEIRKMITPDTLPKITISPTRSLSVITTEVFNNMMYDFFINQLKLKQLEEKYNYDSQMINYYVDKIYKLF